VPKLTLQALAERLAVVEEELARLRRPELSQSKGKNWRTVIGLFPKDEYMKRIDELGKEYRQSQRAELEE